MQGCFLLTQTLSIIRVVAENIECLCYSCSGTGWRTSDALLHRHYFPTSPHLLLGTYVCRLVGAENVAEVPHFPAIFFVWWFDWCKYSTAAGHVSGWLPTPFFLYSHPMVSTTEAIICRGSQPLPGIPHVLSCWWPTSACLQNLLMVVCRQPSCPSIASLEWGRLCTSILNCERHWWTHHTWSSVNWLLIFRN